MTSTTKHVAFLRRSLWLAGGLVLLAIAAILVYQSRSQGNLPDIHWLHVQPQVLENQLGLVGRIEAAKRSTLAAPFEGVVQYLAIVEGQRVESGQHLMTLDTMQLDIKMRDALAAQLKAQLIVQSMEDWSQSEEVTRARRVVTNAQLRLDDTEAKLADTRHLFERGIVARMEVDSLEQQASTQRIDLAASQAELRTTLDKGQGEYRKIAEMELANAQARYQAMQVLHAQSELYAPFSGIVLPPQRPEEGNREPLIQQGANVTQGASLFELASLEEIKAVARVEESDVYQLNEGMPVEISGVGFESITLFGHVESIGARGLPSEPYGGGTTYEVAIAIAPLTPEQRQRIRLGMSAHLAVVTYRVTSGLALPAAALHQDDEGRTFVIYRRNTNEASRKVIVQTGRAVLQGVEVFGMEAGYVELPLSIH